jgi:hypothetical protein
MYNFCFYVSVLKNREGWRCSSVIECLSSMHRTLGSIPGLKKKIKTQARHRWLTPAILSTWKAEIGRMEA